MWLSSAGMMRRRKTSAPTPSHRPAPRRSRTPSHVLKAQHGTADRYETHPSLYMWLSRVWPRSIESNRQTAEAQLLRFSLCDDAAATGGKEEEEEEEEEATCLSVPVWGQRSQGLARGEAKGAS